jgi:hypothetical protein
VLTRMPQKDFLGARSKLFWLVCFFYMAHGWFAHTAEQMDAPALLTHIAGMSGINAVLRL